MIDFLKQTIIDVLSNSNAIRFDATGKMKAKFDSQMQKKISVIVVEDGRSNNTFFIAKASFKSFIYFEAKGLSFVFWTPK